MIRWVENMATAYNLVDYRTIEPSRRPRMRMVEPKASEPAVEAVQAPVVEPEVAVAAAVESALSNDHKLTPPAWLVAPPLYGEPVLSLHESWASHCAVPAAPEAQGEGPYRSIREVPRVGG